MIKDIYPVSEVFGVSNQPIQTYVERKEVDNLFLDGLSRNKHIIVYGSSKQGKTSLTNKHLTADTFVRVNCSHNTTPIDIYKSIIRQLNIEFEESKEVTSTLSGEVKTGLKAKVKIPLLLETEVGADLGGSKEKGNAITYKKVEYNLELAQDIAEILIKTKFNRRIILENFHYLSEDTQKQLAFDLRIFEDYNVLFIILGIWREKNRLAQFNGDLLDRIVEIPVEPWSVDDLKKIIREGEPILNVSFLEIENDIITSSFDSVGVFQEICKEACIKAGVTETYNGTQFILNEQHLKSAIEKKLSDYSSRHIKSIEAFVEQRSRGSEFDDGTLPLYIPYYFIKVLFDTPFDELIEGFKRRALQDKIKAIHHRPDDVRGSDMTYFLKNLVGSQIKKTIIPPIFDYDQSTTSVKIIDSTFYFFMKNCDKEEIMEYIPVPTGLDS